ncbi:MAG: phosphatidylglycerophosphatase A [Desulfarculaceae bacterium]
MAVVVSLGVGLLPGPRGTYGSLLALGAAGLWFSAGGGPLTGPWYLILTAVFSLFSVWVSHQAVAAAVFGPESDPGQIVIDEFAGMMVCLIGAKATPWWELGLAFFVFRFFDIVKPAPINISQRLPGGWGVVADDLLAGGYTLAFLWLWRCWLA